VLAAVMGLVVSLATWCFLELVHQAQVGVFTELPQALGYDDGAPLWWSLPVCGAAGVLVAFAIMRLPGFGGHVPAHGLEPAPTRPVEVPGVMFAALATVGLGLVLGPEAPLLALGSGLGLLAVRLARRDAPPELATVMAAAGSFAAVSFLFEAPVIAAILLIEATGLGGRRLPLLLIPGLLAAGIGSLVSIGIGAFTGLSTSAYAIGALSLPAFERPTFVDVGWTVVLAAGVSAGCLAIVALGRRVHPAVMARPFVLIPAAGLAVSLLAIAFTQLTDKDVDQVLFSGQDAIGPLAAHPGAWSVGALAALLACKGLAWGISLGSFRGGPTFPAMFLGAAAGVLASHLPGFDLTPAVAVGMGAAVVAVLRLPLSAVVLATLLTAQSGLSDTPLIIVGVVVGYLVATALSARTDAGGDPAAAEPEAAGTPSPRRRARHPPRRSVRADGDDLVANRARARSRVVPATGLTRRTVRRPERGGGVAMVEGRARLVITRIGRCRAGEPPLAAAPEL
jgi:H+/Cl- antiporter ClcA